MSYNEKLEKVRTVRLSLEADRRIRARAAEKGRTPSEMIREVIEAEFTPVEETPGQWLLNSVGLGANRKSDRAFSAAYRKRHE